MALLLGFTPNDKPMRTASSQNAFGRAAFYESSRLRQHGDVDLDSGAHRQVGRCAGIAGREAHAPPSRWRAWIWQSALMRWTLPAWSG